jgi:hypothetical protein
MKFFSLSRGAMAERSSTSHDEKEALVKSKNDMPNASLPIHAAIVAAKFQYPLSCSGRVHLVVYEE